jgi:predicted ribosomally synthesized peptide with SipW-like signal peptide
MAISVSQPQGAATGRRRTVLGVALAALVGMSVGAGALSLAIFTDSKTSTGTFSTGTIVLGVSPSTVFAVSNLLPGDSGSQTVTVSNGGTGGLRYALSTSATNADTKGLAAALQLSVYPNDCSAPDGTALFSGALGSAAIGSPNQGPDSGDRGLSAGASEPLCFRWSLPQGSDNSLQSAATTATFTFAAEQTANNP